MRENRHSQSRRTQCTWARAAEKKEQKTKIKTRKKKNRKSTREANKRTQQNEKLARNDGKFQREEWTDFFSLLLLRPSSSSYFCAIPFISCRSCCLRWNYSRAVRATYLLKHRAECKVQAKCARERAGVANSEWPVEYAKTRRRTNDMLNCFLSRMAIVFEPLIHSCEHTENDASDWPRPLCIDNLLFWLTRPSENWFLSEWFTKMNTNFVVRRRSIGRSTLKWFWRFMIEINHPHYH